MTRVTNSPIVIRDGSISTKKDGTKVKMITAKLALEDVEFVTRPAPAGLGLGITAYLRGKIEEDMAKYRGRVKPSNYRSLVARDIYIKNKFYNDIYDRLEVTMNEILDDQNMNRNHLRHCLDMLEKLAVEGQEPIPSFVPDYAQIMVDIEANKPSWFETNGDPLKEAAVNATDLLIVILRFFTRVNPTIAEVKEWLSIFRRITLLDKLDAMKTSESGEAMLSGKLIPRDDPTRFKGWEEDDITGAPWEVE